MTNFAKLLRANVLRLSMKGLPRGPHITRYFMYYHLRRVGGVLPTKGGDVLSISHSSKLAEVLNIKCNSLVEANYPDQDFLNLTYPDQSFDFVLSDQVLEHVEGDPQQAINESWRVLRPGGIAIHTTCFMNPIHGHPHDFWRFTPDALKLLSKKFARVIDNGGWGNFDAWIMIRDGLRFEGVPHAHWHPLHKAAVKNDEKWPIVTWIVTQK